MTDQIVQSRRRQCQRAALKPVPLFLVGKVTDRPGNAVHRSESLDAFIFADVSKSAYELTSRESQLLDEWVNQAVPPIDEPERCV